MSQNETSDHGAFTKFFLLCVPTMFDIAETFKFENICYSLHLISGVEFAFDHHFGHFWGF